MTKPELRKLIELRNKEVVKDHLRRYGKTLPEEPEAARFRRIMDDPRCWEEI